MDQDSKGLAMAQDSRALAMAQDSRDLAMDQDSRDLAMVWGMAMDQAWEALALVTVTWEAMA